jgi:hypothetical protein
MRFITKKVAIILCMLINFGLSMKTEEICSITDRQQTCNDKYLNKCGNSHCSMDRISCKEFLFSNFIVKSLRAQKSQSSKKHDNIFLFLSGIKNCSLKISTNDWLAKDVCKKSKSSV